MSWRIAEDVLSNAPDMSYRELRVLMALAHSADAQTRQCWPGIDYLTAKANCGERAVYRTIAALERRGLIKRVGAASKGHRQVYAIMPMGVASVTPIERGQRVSSERQRVSSDATKGVTEMTPLPSSTSVNTSVNQRAGAREQPPVDAWTGPEMIEMIIKEIEARTGKTIDADEAAWIATTTHKNRANGTTIPKPVGWMRSVIHREPNPRETLMRLRCY
jgi:hypothetical protein